MTAVVFYLAYDINKNKQKTSRNSQKATGLCFFWLFRLFSYNIGEYISDYFGSIIHFDVV